jgi:hypothetical protein
MIYYRELGYLDSLRVNVHGREWIIPDPHSKYKDKPYMIFAYDEDNDAMSYYNYSNLFELPGLKNATIKNLRMLIKILFVAKYQED